MNPTTRLYTWHNIRSFARLDRIYVSTFLKSHIQCITNTPCPISDHDSVNAVFCLPSASRKKSYWKLNVSILEDVEYIHLVHNSILFTYQSVSNAKVNWTKSCGLKINGWDVGLNCKLGISWNTKEQNFCRCIFGGR